MKTEFKLADRVRVYHGEFEPYTGRISSIEGTSFKVQLDSDGTMRFFHRQQLRKLVKKPRREFFIRVCTNSFCETKIVHENISGYKSCSLCEIIHVREVKKK